MMFRRVSEAALPHTILAFAVHLRAIRAHTSPSFYVQATLWSDTCIASTRYICYVERESTLNTTLTGRVLIRAGDGIISRRDPGLAFLSYASIVLPVTMMLIDFVVSHSSPLLSVQDRYLAYNAFCALGFFGNCPRIAWREVGSRSTCDSPSTLVFKLCFYREDVFAIEPGAHSVALATYDAHVQTCYSRTLS